MSVVRSLFIPGIAAYFFTLTISAATFGRVVPLVGGATDLVLDEPRGRIYLTSSIQGVVQVYSIAQQRFLAPIPTDASPISVAMSRDGKALYVTCFDASVLDVIDLASLTVSDQITLPARPEGVAVGNDGRVLISTTGSAGGNVLLLYDPSPTAAVGLTSITVAPPAPTPPTLPPPSGRPFLSTRSQLLATRDGSKIVGVNLPAAGAPSVFVYEVSSAAVLRARVVIGSSNVLSVSDDGSRFMCGPNLFDTATLQVLAQQNVANSPYPLPANANFNLQSNQGGSVFSPDGQTVYSAFDISPVQNPPAAANVSQLMMSDPDNLLIRMGLQLPENLAGKMVIGADGANAYALSESGLLVLPMGTIFQSPLAVPSTGVVLLTSDQCGVTAQTSSATVGINNPGRGRVTASGQLLQIAGQANQPSPATAPTVRPGSPLSPQLQFGFNATLAARGLGTIAPPHDILVQSPEAINIPDRVRVYENSRNAEARGTIIPVPVGISPNQALEDLVYDQPRQRLYIANAGLNRVEVFDIPQQKFLAPIKVGQLPRSLALTPDGNTLYVANSGAESISIVDPNNLQVVDRVMFPPIPFNSNLALMTPTVIAAGLSGVEIIMSNGTLWKVIGNNAVPRGISRVIGQTAQGLPVALPALSSMAATPGGEFILLATPTGFVYLYDAVADDFVQGRQIFTVAPAGYIGPIAAGPRGQYFVVNGTVLNQALTPSGRSGVTGLISAVATAGNNSLAVFSPPPGAGAAALPAAPPTVQTLDVTTGATLRQVSALEGPLTQVAAAGRATIGGRTMAIDSTGGTAYAITISGLSIIPLAPVLPAERPQPNLRGTVNLASYQAAMAPNGLISIFGQNLGDNDVAETAPLPAILGGTCVTLNNRSLPLIMVSPTQINAQIPPDMAAGSFPIVVRSIARQAPSATQQVAISKYAPAVLVDSTGQLALFHDDGRYVTRDQPATRDQRLTLYAVGLGVTTGGKVTAGALSPSSPLAVTAPVQVFFGDPNFKQAEIIVEWSGLTPQLIGVYQINLRVPGFHMNGDSLPVTIRIGGVESPGTGPVVPYVALN